MKKLILILCVIILSPFFNGCGKNHDSSALSKQEKKLTISEALSSGNEEDALVNQFDKLLEGFGNYCKGYIQCKFKYDENTVLDTENPMLISQTNIEGIEYQEKWFQVISADITTFSGLVSEAEKYCSDDMMNNILPLLEHNYISENDNLYVADFAGDDGGVMGSDYAYIDSYSLINENYAVIKLIAYGDKNYWETESDTLTPFQVSVKKENGIWKVDECGEMEQAYLAWIYKSLEK
jgi:hypothetical protein